jgi:hypothetical protein
MAIIIWFKTYNIRNLTTLLIKKGENIVNGVTNIKVKVLFQRLHITCVIFVFIYNLKIYILGTQFNATC